jgi:virginiamycin B lyase
VGTVNDLAAGPDGNVWYTRGNGVADAAVGYVTPAGVIRQFDLPIVEGFQESPRGITTGPDGAMWFTRSSGSVGKIVRMTTSGAVREFPIPQHLNGGLEGITTGPDGNLWFCQEEWAGSAA